jgi:hypothetical protein
VAKGWVFMAVVCVVSRWDSALPLGDQAYGWVLMCCAALLIGVAVAAGTSILHVHGYATPLQGTAAAGGGTCADRVCRYTVMQQYTTVHHSTV